MKSTGMVRPVDELGRIVLPIEMRRTLGINEKDALEIFKDGEERFRAIEAEALRDLVVMSQVTGKDIVISLGGGTITIGSARRLILEQTTCIYLRTDLDTIFKRLGTRSKSRPLFHDKLKVEDLMDTRAPLYEMAHFTVRTDGKSPAEIAEEILGMIVR